MTSIESLETHRSGVDASVFAEEVFDLSAGRVVSGVIKAVKAGGSKVVPGVEVKDPERDSENDPALMTAHGGLSAVIRIGGGSIPAHVYPIPRGDGNGLELGWREVSPTVIDGMRHLLSLGQMPLR